jgi:UDP-GlcNAc:undecaprenyl-phosphate GlcNAc-1-phosphate transferase
MSACAPVGSAVVAAAVSSSLVPVVVAHAPAALQRTNVSGATVPAVLGGPLAAGALAGLGAAALCSVPLPAAFRRVLGTSAGLVGVMGLVGLADDARGDELARGFRGHLGALRRGHVTGGTLKVATGAAAGLVAGRTLRRGRAALEVAALVALGANLINLADRAPGRAAKVGIALAAPLCALGAPEYRAVGSSLLGALVACLPADLGEQAMLGDAGANALGAVLGLGLGTSLGPRGRGATTAALVALTAASERWSFSVGIERVATLRWLDGLGRRPNPRAPC